MEMKWPSNRPERGHKRTHEPAGLYRKGKGNISKSI